MLQNRGIRVPLVRLHNREFFITDGPAPMVVHLLPKVLSWLQPEEHCELPVGDGRDRHIIWVCRDPGILARDPSPSSAQLHFHGVELQPGHFAPIHLELRPQDPTNEGPDTLTGIIIVRLEVATGCILPNGLVWLHSRGQVSEIENKSEERPHVITLVDIG